MPRYFFHTQTTSRTTDDDGEELPNALAARNAAIEASAELMRGSANQFWGSRPWTVTVTDEAGLVLWEITVDGHASAAAQDMD